MRSVKIVPVDKIIKALLLLQGIECGRFGGLLFESEMHSFVSPVLLGVARFDAFDGNAEA